MKPTVYIETTIISYLAARPAKDLQVRGHQLETHLWWDGRRTAFELYTSIYVQLEAARGDPIAAAERMKLINGIALLRTGPEIELLAKMLVSEAALPPAAEVDAFHLAAATCNGIDFLMTWNCRHLANAMLWRKIDAVCKAEGYIATSICTPFALLGDAYDPRPDR